MITSENYVEHVLNTDCEYNEELNERLINCSRLLHSAIGIATESGEFLDALKKHIYQNKPLDIVNAKEEAGDLYWYIGLALDEMNITMNAVLTQNINKLKLRYPNKFSEEKALNRDVNAERVLLEANVYSEREFTEKIFKSEQFTQQDCEQDVDITKLDSSSPEYIPKPFKPYSQRGLDWIAFSNKVLTHIEEYTTKQYGDAGADIASEYTPEYSLSQADKYFKRFGKVDSKRQLRDFLKMAHYVQLAETKYQEEQNK